jgi:hypothetical protein
LFYHLKKLDRWNIVYDQDRQDSANPLVVMEMSVAIAGWFSLAFALSKSLDSSLNRLEKVQW